MTETMEIGLVGAGAVIIGAVFGGFFSGPYHHLRDCLSRPKIKIDYEGTAANKIEIDYQKKRRHPGC